MSYDLSKVEPYELKTDATNPNTSFTFTTDYGIDYAIIFEDITDRYTENDIGKSTVLQYEFFKVTGKDNSYDRRIMATIILSISKAMNVSDNVIVFMCDNADGKANSRARLFHSIFSANNTKNLDKIDGTIFYKDEITYISFLISSNNPYKEKIDYTFNSNLFKEDLKKSDSFRI
jgi:hypothetical protein